MASVPHHGKVEMRCGSSFLGQPNMRGFSNSDPELVVSDEQHGCPTSHSFNYTQSNMMHIIIQSFPGQASLSAHGWSVSFFGQCAFPHHQKIPRWMRVSFPGR